MKRYVFLVITFLFFLKINAQNKIRTGVLEFITEDNNSILIYADDIKTFDEQSFEIVDTLKVELIKGKDIREVYFLCGCCGNSKMGLENILSSNTSDNELYIHVLGNNKVHFIKGYIVECSKLLIGKIQKRIK